MQPITGLIDYPCGLQFPGASGFACRRAQDVLEVADTSEVARTAAENEWHRVPDAPIL